MSDGLAVYLNTRAASVLLQPEWKWDCDFASYLYSSSMCHTHKLFRNFSQMIVCDLDESEEWNEPSTTSK